jgi:subtilase family serine protease
MIRISGIKRRISAAVVLVALAAPFAGTAPLAANSAGTMATVEAVCPPATPGTAQCLALRRTDVAAVPASAVSPLTSPPGYSPADLQSAYGLPSGSQGSGLTVAIVDAYDLPTAEADLAAYRSQYGLPPCTIANLCFRKVDQNGGTSYPVTAVGKGWDGEIALDIDMVSAICPNCHILLVEANDNYNNNLGAAVNTAVSLGAVAVSNSYAGPEWSGETYYDRYYNHPGVAITAGTGDCGYNCAANYPGIGYPAASQYVIAVGGTTLTRNGSARGWTESAWGDAAGWGAGSGCSMYEPKPSWQHDTGCAKRTEADVSAVAGGSGVAVYVNGLWTAYGGTSVASPIIAAIYALAGRPAAGTYPASYLYGNTAALNDVLGGNNDVTWHTCTVTYLCNGVAGYDGPTGLGTPNGIGAFTAPIPAIPSTYHPVAPIRLLDTRLGNGLSAKLSANTPATFQITGREGIPSNATAVTGNVTVVNPTSSWAVYLGPDPVANPGSSTINFNGGDIKANGVTVALSATGSLSATYMSFAGNTTDLVFDVTGFFTSGTTGATYHAIDPARLLDTRYDNGLSARLSANTPATFQITGREGIPANATAVTGNVTVVGSTNSWAVYIGPLATASPGSSTINFNAGDIVANNLTVALGAGGTLSATYMSFAGNSTDLVFDVTGFYTADLTGDAYVPIAPTRLVDSRSANGLSTKLSANTPATFVVAGRNGIPSSATAVSGNVTVVNSSFSWAIFLGPNPTSSPGSSTLNFNKGDIVANGLTVSLGSDGSLSATFMSFNGNTTDLVFDVTGYFVPAGG